MIKITEAPYEKTISQKIRAMPFIWLEVDDDPGPESLRGYIERNTIALLSNACQPDYLIDPPSPSWLGHWAKNPKIRASGLWNANHVDENPDSNFFETLNSLI